MYLAKTVAKGKISYILRQSYLLDNTMVHRDLFDLGSNPEKFIVYPGRNAFYIHESIDDRLGDLGITADDDLLEDLFWPFVKPDIRRSVETFRQRRTNKKSHKELSAREKERLRKAITPFDKRRLHYLKFGRMDQGAVENMPPALFTDLMDQSRDEMEQHFIREERILKARELKSYVYVIFNLQGFFRSFMARRMPQAMDQDKVETHFVQEICTINEQLFQSNTKKPGQEKLHPYLVRYVIMFFDNDYLGSTLLDDFVNDFIYRHRFFKPKPQGPSLTTEKICSILTIDAETLESMGTKELTSLYRKLARKHHPDKGGSNETFVKLKNAYEEALKTKEKQTKL